ncbi:MAG TPA: uroporphyrinogen decarboxylase family protein, partial [Actinomycetota bacterium]|nr:uroporphyrinogen decarboxylase family protein [Actinomycetota bacterium]
MSSQASGHTQTAPESLKTQRFLRACAREPVDATPVWMMRQAGRSLPAYRELRSRYGFLDLTGKPDLMAQITLMPLDVMEVDAAIRFA